MEEGATRIVLARALLLLDEVGEARMQLADAGPHLRRWPDAIVLEEWSREVAEQAEAAPAEGRWPLSAAELRLLHYLPTHLTFPEIADDLVVSHNTVKAQTQSIYRKLGVSSRGEAVACAHRPPVWWRRAGENSDLQARHGLLKSGAHPAVPHSPQWRDGWGHQGGDCLTPDGRNNSSCTGPN